jgi:hypothetical protein
VARARQQLDFWDLVKLRFDNGVATDAEAVGRVAHLAFEGGDPLVRRDVVAEDGCFDDDSSDHERRSSSNQPR